TVAMAQIRSHMILARAEHSHAHELLKLPVRADFAHVEVAAAVSPDSVRKAAELMRERTLLSPLRQDLAVAVQNRDAVGDFGHENHFVAIEPEFVRSQKAGPLCEIAPVAVKDLNAIVFAVANIDAIVRIHPHAVNQIELPRSRPRFAP